ncbi:MAG: hypothetical protein H6742_10775 [Alphaproteobacteria bacterium]|nr:hypothetical protein [Alphaproteobacteria bacterium]
MARCAHLLPVLLLTACFAKADDDDDDGGGDDTTDTTDATDGSVDVPPDPGEDDPPETGMDTTVRPEDTGMWGVGFRGSATVGETYDGWEEYYVDHFPEGWPGCTIRSRAFGTTAASTPCSECEWTFTVTMSDAEVLDDVICDGLGWDSSSFDGRTFGYGYNPSYYYGAYEVLMYQYGSTWYALALAEFDGTRFGYDRLFDYYYY